MIIIPIVFSVVYNISYTNKNFANWWVSSVLKPTAQTFSGIVNFIPFSLGEVIVICLIIFTVAYLIRTIVISVKRKQIKYSVRFVAYVLSAVLWIQAGMSWCWNITYYADTFTELSEIEVVPYSVDELYEVTAYYAQQSATYSTMIERDDDGIFNEDVKEIFQDGESIYDNMEEEFTFLEMVDRSAKPLIFSRLQSVLGFTGVYFPFTGEANVNADCPSVFLPVTIAHEMSHQRMVASENEANFVGITTSIKSENIVYMYSGYMYGLIQLSNALYPDSPEMWQEIVDEYFTDEMRADWNYNSEYWNSFESELESNVDEVAESTYDTFLKNNDQELGVKSYGACVDLLIAYYFMETN